MDGAFSFVTSDYFVVIEQTAGLLDPILLYAFCVENSAEPVLLARLQFPDSGGDGASSRRIIDILGGSCGGPGERRMFMNSLEEGLRLVVSDHVWKPAKFTGTAQLFVTQVMVIKDRRLIDIAKSLSETDVSKLTRREPSTFAWESWGMGYTTFLSAPFHMELTEPMSWKRLVRF